MAVEIYTPPAPGSFFPSEHIIKPTKEKTVEEVIKKVTKKEIDNLFIEDANKIRDKLQEILLRYNLITIEKPKNEKIDLFKKEDVEWFEKSKNNMLNKFGGLNGR